MSNNTKGILTYSILTILTTSILTLPLMVLRELYQYKKYLKPCGLNFEWDDIVRYSFVIIAACILMDLVLVTNGVVK